MPTTIAAVATPPGAGGIAIIRVSGPEAEAILRGCFRPYRAARRFQSHRLYYGWVVRDGEVIDEAMAVLMRAPNSYTREDVAELHCHGGRVAAERVLRRALELGAVPAEPGEFTKRAFLNGRIDLSRAEAVMEMIGAGGEAAARASARQLEGGVSTFVRGLSRRLTDALAAVEACTDFPDEVEEETAAAETEDEMRAIAVQLRKKADGRGARILREGASIVLAGPPNAGKSSLMNALLRRERAIVTAIPGTTRDVLTERVVLGGVAAELSDTAGLRHAGDAVERIGVARAQAAVDRADLVLVVLDGSVPPDAEARALLHAEGAPRLICLNKADLGLSHEAEARARASGLPVFPISALSGAGVEALADHLAERLKGMAGAEDALTVERHLRLARAAAEALERGADGIAAGYPLDAACVDLNEALRLLGEITGENAAEAVIDSVFAHFCVGK